MQPSFFYFASHFSHIFNGAIYSNVHFFYELNITNMENKGTGITIFSNMLFVVNDR